jgi:hypothetical protein
MLDVCARMCGRACVMMIAVFMGSARAWVLVRKAMYYINPSNGNMGDEFKVSQVRQRRERR